MIYSYRASVRGEAVVSGYVEASSSEEAVSKLLSRGFSPIEVKLDIMRTILPLKPSAKHLTVICSALAELIAAGYGVHEALAEAKEVAPTTVTARMLDEARVLVSVLGMELGAALQSVGFPEFMATQISVGARSGNLVGVLRRLSEMYSWRASLISGLISNLIYPAFVFILGVACILFVLLHVVPKLEPIFCEIKNPPASMRIMFSISHFLRSNSCIVVAGFLAVLFSLWAARSLLAEFLKNLFVEHAPGTFFAKNPVCSLVQQFELSNLFESISLMLEAGYPMLSALSEAGKVLSSRVLRESLGEVIKAVKRGTAFSVALSEIVTDRMVLSMVRVGDRTGELSEYTRKAAHYLYDRVDTTMRRLSVVIQVLAVVGVVLFLTAIMGSLLLSFYRGMASWVS